MPRLSHVFRAIALLCLGAIAVHEARYLVGFDATDRLAHDERAYLSVGVSVAALMLVLALASLARCVLRARQTGAQSARGPRPFALVWFGSSLALAGVYVLQELLESAAVEGHPGGLEGVLGHAGWVGFVAAVIVGALIAYALRGAHGLVARAAASGARARRRASAVSVRHSTRVRRASRPPVLALNLAGRAPPASPR